MTNSTHIKRLLSQLTEKEEADCLISGFEHIYNLCVNDHEKSRTYDINIVSSIFSDQLLITSDYVTKSTYLELTTLSGNQLVDDQGERLYLVNEGITDINEDSSPILSKLGTMLKRYKPQYNEFIYTESEVKEDLGQAIDSLENCTASLTAMTMLPDRIHVDCLRGNLPDIVKRLKKGFVKVTGENPWEEG